MSIISYLRKSRDFRVSPVHFERDPRIEALFADIIQRFPPFTPYDGPVDAEYSIRPSIARKLAQQSRDGMIIGLGCYVGDVRGTIEKALSLVQADKIDEAQTQLRALVGRIVISDSANIYMNLTHTYYQHHGTHRPKIGLVSSDLDCGVGTDLLGELGRLSVLPANAPPTAAEFESACSNWHEDFAGKAQDVISFVEGFVAGLPRSRFRLIKRRKA